MNTKMIKLALLNADKSQKELLFEVRKKGYPVLSQPALNSYINGTVITPQSEAVLKVCEQIFKEWETAK